METNSSGNVKWKLFHLCAELRPPLAKWRMNKIKDGSPSTVFLTLTTNCNRRLSWRHILRQSSHFSKVVIARGIPLKTRLSGPSSPVTFKGQVAVVVQSWNVVCVAKDVAAVRKELRDLECSRLVARLTATRSQRSRRDGIAVIAADKLYQRCLKIYFY